MSLRDWVRRGPIVRRAYRRYLSRCGPSPARMGCLQQEIRAALESVVNRRLRASDAFPLIEAKAREVANVDELDDMEHDAEEQGEFLRTSVLSRPVKDPPNLIRSGAFTLDRLLSHIDPGPQEESEEFVRRIYEQRHIDLSSDRNGKTRR